MEMVGGRGVKILKGHSLPSALAGPNAQNGFGLSFDTIGDFNGAPGIGPGEPLNVQFAMKVIF